MGFAFVEEADQAGHDADGGNGDAARAHGIAPLRGENLDAFEDFIQIIERFAHAHINDVGYRTVFFNHPNLIYDFACSKLSVKALFACHAKQATQKFTRLENALDAITTQR